MTLLAFMMTAVAAGIITALRATDLGAERTAATQVATRAIEQIRAKPFDQVLDELGVSETTETLDGRDYGVTTNSYWVGVDTDSDPCESPLEADLPDASSVVRIEVDVRPVEVVMDPIRVETLRAPPGGTTRPNTGTLIVKVVDHDGQPIQTAIVEASGTSNLGVATTGADGCVVYGNVDPGNYEVTARKAGYVGPDDTALATDPGAEVEASTTKGTILQLAPAATVSVTPVSSGGGALPDTATRAYQLLGGEVTHVLGPADLTARGDLFPSARRVVAGTCPDADPLGVDDDGNRIWPSATTTTTPLEPGQTTALDVRYATVEVRTKAAGVTFSATNPDCVDGTASLSWTAIPTEDVVATGVNYVYTLAVPFGTWDFSTSCGSGPQRAVMDPSDVAGSVSVNFNSGPPGSC